MIKLILFFASCFLYGVTTNPAWFLIIGVMLVFEIIGLIPQSMRFSYATLEHTQGMVIATIIAVFLGVCIVYIWNVPDEPVIRHGALTNTGYCNHLVNPHDEDGLCDKCGGKL